MSIHCAIPGDVARAIDLGACAKYRGAPATAASRDFALEGHHKGGMFLLRCRTALIPYLVRDIEAVAAKAQSSHVREACETAIATLREELAREDNPSAFPARPSSEAFGRNSFNR